MTIALLSECLLILSASLLGEGLDVPSRPPSASIVFGTKVACVAAISGNSLSIGKRDFDLGHASSLRSGLARPPKTTLLPPGLPSLA
jgi:hypothetical protein